MKAISKGSLAGCLVYLDAGSAIRLALQNLDCYKTRADTAMSLRQAFKFLSMLITGHYPASFLMLIHLLEISSHLVALMPFWSLPYLLKNANRLSLLICTRCLTSDNTAEMYIEFRSSTSTRGRCTSLRSPV